MRAVLARGAVVVRTYIRSRIHPGDGDDRHGTTNGYCNLRCRCDACTSAWRAYHASLRIRKAKTLAADDPRHGLSSTYANFNCRCQPCTKANTASRSAR